MTQAPVKETIKKLIAIQKIDEELYDFKRQIKEKPAEIEDLRLAYEKKKARFNELQTRSQQFELEKKSKELDLKTKEQAIVTSNAQLMTLKTNKEYQAKLFEIENIKADKSILEDDILKLMEALDKIGQEITAEKNLLAEEEKKYLAEKAKVDEQINLLKDREAVLEAQRKEAAAGVDPRMLAIYQQVVENREGVALVPVVGNSCGGCFMHQPPQVINKLRMHEEVVRCEICARLLYLQEDV